jgi:SAM-dependent methyltransferase
MKKNFIAQQLAGLQIIDYDHVTVFHEGVRDNPLIKVMKCLKSGVFFLSEDHMTTEYYHKKEGVSYWGNNNREELLKETYEDDKRRFTQFENLLKGKKYLDVGTGLGGMLDLSKNVTSELAGVELQNEVRDQLKSIGYVMYASSQEIPTEQKYDVISLFHVFEHLTDPLAELKTLYDHLSPGGKIIIEVPHAKDALLSFFDLEAFQKFTFWSEHLILHTRASLEIYLKTIGFKNISISGFQRYPLSNHLLWLWKGKPGGHVELSQFRNEDVDTAYMDLLDSIDATDTLIAIAEK